MSNDLYPNLVKPGPAETVMRYTSLAQLAWIMTNGKIPLTRIDLFRDPFEGSATKSMLDQQLLLQGGRNQMAQQNAVLAHHYPDFPRPNSASQMSSDIWTDMTARRKNRTFSTHASCWRKGTESEGMWRLYCGEKEGIAFRTTFSQLEVSIEDSQIIAGEIRYGDYKTMEPFTNDLDHVMYKREGFSFEQEVRLLKTDNDHYLNLCRGVAQEKLDPCLPLVWNLQTAIGDILVSPYADSWYLDAVRAVVRLADATLEDRVAWSELRAKPDF